MVSVQISPSGSKPRIVGRDTKMSDAVLFIERYLDVEYPPPREVPTGECVIGSHAED